MGKRIVIIGGEIVGLELAEFLAERGREVCVVDEAKRFGHGLTLIRRLRLLAELREHGVQLVQGASDIVITRTHVECRDGDGVDTSLPADNVIIARGAKGNRQLAEMLQAENFTVHEIGDCAGVGYIEGAMRGAMTVSDTINGS
jgi:pyruvate/2-oxoglutarate dehydrogenase complex dihydrolipoamide dehydrogenase (E3) component